MKMGNKALTVLPLAGIVMVWLSVTVAVPFRKVATARSLVILEERQVALILKDEPGEATLRADDMYK